MEYGSYDDEKRQGKTYSIKCHLTNRFGIEKRNAAQTTKVITQAQKWVLLNQQTRIILVQVMFLIGLSFLDRVLILSVSARIMKI